MKMNTTGALSADDSKKLHTSKYGSNCSGLLNLCAPYRLPNDQDRANSNQPLKRTDDEVASIAKTVGTFNDDELRNNFLDLVLQLSVTD